MAESVQPTPGRPDGAGQRPADLLFGFADAIALPVVVLTPDARVRHANAAFVEALDIAAEHYLHQKFPRRWLMHPQDALPQLRQMLHRAGQPGSNPEPVPLSLRSSNGAEIPAQVCIRPLPDLRHNPDGLLVVTFMNAGHPEAPASADRPDEETGCQARQDELIHSEQRFRLLFEYAPDGYYLCDLNGRFLDGNRAAENIVGYSREELIGKSFLKLKLLDKGQLAKAARTLVKNAIGKPTGPDEFTLHRKDGSRVTVEIRTYPIRLQGQVLVLGIARDITERQRAQEAILQEKAFSESVINSMPGVFYMLDEQGHYVWWNQNLENVTEYSGDEIRCIHPLDLFEGPDRQRIADAMETVFTQGQATAEADLVSKRGRKTPYFFTGLRVERNGQHYLIGLGINITERRKAELILEKLNADLETSIRELERSNQELRDFAHITAHDLKAPLRGIATMADWLDQDYGERIGPEGRENLHLLRTRVDHMGRLISGILRYSEIQHNDRPAEMVDTHTLVREVIEQIAPPDRVEIHIDNTLPAVEAERTRLMQIFQNLISNAVKYIDKPQGQVHISARDDGDFWEFRVTDNGPGIEAKHFARIFQMFQTLSSSDRCESTGLGLATVKKIIGLYGGRVWIESEMGRGSAFIFTLPKHQPEQTGQ